VLGLNSLNSHSVFVHIEIVSSKSLNSSTVTFLTVSGSVNTHGVTLILLCVFPSNIGGSITVNPSGVTTTFTSTLFPTCSPALSVAISEIVNSVSSSTSKPLITNSSPSMSALFASHSIENVNLSPYGKSASQNTFSFKLILFSPVSDTSIVSEKS
jgi:hypothetical protein